MKRGSEERKLKSPRLVRGFFIVMTLFPVLVGVHGCGSRGPHSDLVILEGEAQGTTFRIKYLDEERRDLSSSIDSLFRVIDRSLSLWDSASTVSRFNRAVDRFVTNDVHFRTLLAHAESAYLGTEGAFDPTVLPLVDAWGLGKSGREALDTAAVIDLLPLVGLNKLSLEEVSDPSTGKVVSAIYYKSDPRVRLDPNGIAQGYTVDRIAELLRTRGIADHMVEVGGEVCARGVNGNGTPWTIQIDKPLDGAGHVRQTVVELQDRSLATSGNYRKFIEVDGKRYGHTIDPRTGRPAMNSLLSASVIAPDCVSADALGTALMVMGTDAAKAWLGRHREFEAYLLSDDGEGGLAVWSTPGWPEMVDR